MKIKTSTFGPILLSVLGLTLSGCSLFGGTPPELYSFDLLNKDLAKRVKDQILGPDNLRHSDFIVGLTVSSDPIGTIYRSDSISRAISKSACTTVTPASVSAFYFPSEFNLTKEAAVALGLDPALTKLAELGINLSGKQGINLKFSKNTQTELDDQQVANVISLNQTCKAAIDGQEVRFVRGYVSVKRDFSASASNNFDINVKAEKIGTLTIKPVAGSREVKIVDDEPSNFIQIIQVVRGALPGGAPGGLPGGIHGVMPPSITPRPVDLAQDKGLTYIQIDASDTTNNAVDLQKRLRSQNILVASDIEKIKASQMPAVTQVRYFNATDKAKAERILASVRELKPDAVSIRVGLPAPIGQTEIWLTR
jgi:hypothetical protein